MSTIITKASGQLEPFNEEKLRKSLLRAGASASLADQMVRQITGTVTTGMTTKHIYKVAHNLLSKIARPIAGRYHLKTGIMELGPSGFPFEKYVS